MLARTLLLSNLSPDPDPSMGRQFSRRREPAGGGAPGGPPSGGLSRPGRRRGMRRARSASQGLRWPCGL